MSGEFDFQPEVAEILNLLYFQSLYLKIEVGSRKNSWEKLFEKQFCVIFVEEF